MDIYLIAKWIMSFGPNFFLGPGFAIFVVVIFYCLFLNWKLYEKAEEPGWASVVPIYNWYILVRIAGKPPWWFLLCFVPIVNIFVWFPILIGVAKNFGKPAWFGAMWPILPMICASVVVFDHSKFVDTLDPIEEIKLAPQPMICPTCNVPMNKVSAYEPDPLFICPNCHKQQIRMVQKQT